MSFDALLLGGMVGTLLLWVGFGGWWWWRRQRRGKFDARLPNVHVYGGDGNLQPSVLASDYSLAEQVITQHLLEGFPYMARMGMLTATEWALIQALQSALLGKPYMVLWRVRVSEVLTVKPLLSALEQETAVKRLADKYLDVVVYDVDRAVVGLVLLWAEAGLGGRLQDKFVREALGAAGIGCVSVEPAGVYSHEQVAGWLQVLGVEKKRQCPNCGQDLRLTIVKQGKRQGEKVWVCRAYPACKMVLADKS